MRFSLLHAKYRSYMLGVANADFSGPRRKQHKGQIWTKRLRCQHCLAQSSPWGSGQKLGFVSLLALQESVQNLTEPSDSALTIF